MLTQPDPPGTAVLGLCDPNTRRARSGPAEATACWPLDLALATACLPGVWACVWGALRPGHQPLHGSSLGHSLCPQAPPRLVTPAYQPGSTLRSVALERVIISTSGQDHNHKKKNGNRIHWN